jgi:hypothetical protein
MQITKTAMRAYKYYKIKTMMQIQKYPSKQPFIKVKEQKQKFTVHKMCKDITTLHSKVNISKT